MDLRPFLASFFGAAMLVAAGPGKAEEAADPNLVARGSYLAKAADCMPCHTSARDKAYAGGLRINTPFGAIQLIAFLKKGAANNSTVLGPMQEVVHDSLSFLTAGDLDAMATYLLDLTNEKNAPKPELVAKASQ